MVLSGLQLLVVTCLYNLNDAFCRLINNVTVDCMYTNVYYINAISAKCSVTVDDKANKSYFIIAYWSIMVMLQLCQIIIIISLGYYNNVHFQE